MPPDTTTDSIVPDDVGAPAAQPTQDDTSTAATTPTEPTTTPTEAPAEPAAGDPPTDDNLAWLQKKGIDPSSPEAISKVAEMYRNAEKAMHESTEKASNLEKSLKSDMVAASDAGDTQLVEQLAQQVQSLTLTQDVNNFFTATDLPDANRAQEAAARKAAEPAMAKLVNEDETLAQLVRGGYISYDKLYAMARGSDPNFAAQIKSDGGREALQQVANKQLGRSVPGAATSSATSEDSAGDPFLDGFNSI